MNQNHNLFRKFFRHTDQDPHPPDQEPLPEVYISPEEKHNHRVFGYAFAIAFGPYLAVLLVGMIICLAFDIIWSNSFCPATLVAMIATPLAIKYYRDNRWQPPKSEKLATDIREHSVGQINAAIVIVTIVLMLLQISPALRGPGTPAAALAVVYVCAALRI